MHDLRTRYADLMTTIDTARGTATIRLSRIELYTLNNALNEVCNGLDIEEFATRMGVEREEASDLLGQIHTLIARVEGSGPPSAPR